jgi:hypothetical protein
VWLQDNFDERTHASHESPLVCCHGRDNLVLAAPPGNMLSKFGQQREGVFHVEPPSMRLKSSGYAHLRTARWLPPPQVQAEAHRRCNERQDQVADETQPLAAVSLR